MSPEYENPLARPSHYPLDRLLKELKYGRSAKDQRWLDEKIAELIGWDTDFLGPSIHDDPPDDTDQNKWGDPEEWKP